VESLLILGIAILSLAVVALGLAYLGARSSVRRLKGLAGRYEKLELRTRDLETQNRFFGRLIEDYLGFMRELYRIQSLRKIPGLLLKFMVWLFEPSEAVVLIRRRPAVADSNREHQLIVAASMGSVVHKGTVIPLSGDSLSRVAATGIALDQADGSDSSGLPGFTPDLAVPLAIDDDILGVLALMRPRQQRPHARQLLRLFAQSATLAHKSASTLNRIRSEADLDPLTGVRALPPAVEWPAAVLPRES
jgi:GAF domain-containing protein